LTRAYIRHLFKSGEVLALRLATWHNLAFLHRLMEEMRAAIRQGTFPAFRTEFLRMYRRAGTSGDPSKGD
ncbi:MAG: tRNA-guanine transglycosylase, partial [Limnochordales bacterium]